MTTCSFVCSVVTKKQKILNDPWLNVFHKWHLRIHLKGKKRWTMLCSVKRTGFLPGYAGLWPRALSSRLFKAPVWTSKNRQGRAACAATPWSVPTGTLTEPVSFLLSITGTQALRVLGRVFSWCSAGLRSYIKQTMMVFSLEPQYLASCPHEIIS